MSPAPTATELRSAYLEALVAPDPPAARELVRSAQEAGLAIPELLLDVIAPALHEVGDRWERGEVTVAHEHLASEVSASLVAEMAERLRRPPTAGRLAVVSCSPGEQHCVGAHMVEALLEAAGWEVLYLGRSLPLADLAGLVDGERPDAVALSTTIPEAVEGAAEAVEALRALESPPVVMVGGQAYPDERAARAVGAQAWSPDAAGAAGTLEALLPE